MYIKNVLYETQKFQYMINVQGSLSNNEKRVLLIFVLSEFEDIRDFKAYLIYLIKFMYGDCYYNTKKQSKWKLYTSFTFNSGFKKIKLIPRWVLMFALKKKILHVILV